jgi:Uma2 family endonuclease
MVEREPMKSPSGAVKLTYDDFVLFPDDGMRHELIDGEHYVTPSPNLIHQTILGNLYLVIASWLETSPIGHVYLSPLDVVISQFDVVEPDLLFVANARAADILTEKNVQGIPDLVVEIASRSTRQRDDAIKLQLYERAGAQEYWTVDPYLQIVRVYRRHDASLKLVVELPRAGSEPLRSSLLPGLDIPIERIFRNTPVF